MSLTAVSGYYDGTKIIPDENISLHVGQKVIITILGDSPEQGLGFPVHLNKYRGRGPKMFEKGFDSYLKGLQKNVEM